jgi:dihydroxyacetone kinase
MLDGMNKKRLQKHLQKLTNAAQLSFAERALLQYHNQFLIHMNNEAKARRKTKSEVLGTARVMSYEDLNKARADRAAKEAKKAAKEAKKAAFDSTRKKVAGRRRTL